MRRACSAPAPRAEHPGLWHRERGAPQRDAAESAAASRQDRAPGESSCREGRSGTRQNPSAHTRDRQKLGRLSPKECENSLGLTWGGEAASFPPPSWGKYPRNSGSTGRSAQGRASVLENHEPQTDCGFWSHLPNLKTKT